MRLLLLPLLALAISLGGCSSSEPASGTASKKGFSVWPFHGGEKGPEDATSVLEYQRRKGEGESPIYQLFARNTHPTKTVEGQIRFTLDEGANQSKVESESFTLGPNEEKKLFVYPTQTHVTYEVSAFFKQ